MNKHGLKDERIVFDARRLDEGDLLLKCGFVSVFSGLVISPCALASARASCPMVSDFFILSP
jgi:hypothetical protein